MFTLDIFASGNVVVYRGNSFTPTEKLTKEEKHFILDKVQEEFFGEYSEAKPKDYALSARAEERALEFYPMKDYNKEPNYIHSCDSKTLDEVYRQVFMLGYEQAEKDINREMLDRMNEIREKQTKAALEDLNYTIKIDPALGFDEGSVVVYHGKEIISALTIQDLELLHTFLYAVKNNKHGAFTFTRLTDEQYAEVLKRYLEAKK